MTADRITQLLHDIELVDPAKAVLVKSLRDLILGLSASVTEEVKYGGILFSAGRPFCGVFSYTNHVSLEFAEGAAFPDKYKMLEGTGKLRRHIKLLSSQDIVDKHVRHFLLLGLQRTGRP